MDQMTKQNKAIMFACTDAQTALGKAMDHYSKSSRKRKTLLKISQEIDKFLCTLPMYDDGTPEE